MQAPSVAPARPPVAATPEGQRETMQAPSVARVAPSEVPRDAAQPASRAPEAQRETAQLPPVSPRAPDAQRGPKQASEGEAPLPARPPVPTRARPTAEDDEDELVASTLSRGGVAEVHATPAPLWRRLAAFAIDAAIVFGVVALFFVVAASVAGVHAPNTEFHGVDKVMVYLRAFDKVLKQVGALGLLIALLYATVFAVLWNGRTLGRRIVGIQLVDASGLPPQAARALVRSLLAVFSFALFLGGFWLALFDRRGQTLHDKLTRTFVILPSSRGR